MMPVVIAQVTDRFQIQGLENFQRSDRAGQRQRVFSHRLVSGAERERISIAEEVACRQLRVFRPDRGTVMEDSPGSEANSGGGSGLRKFLQPACVSQLRNARRGSAVECALGNRHIKTARLRKIDAAGVIAGKEELAAVINRGDVKDIYAKLAAFLNKRL